IHILSSASSLPHIYLSLAVFPSSFLQRHLLCPFLFSFFFFNDTAPTEIYTLSLHDALPISASGRAAAGEASPIGVFTNPGSTRRSEEHTSELQSRGHLVCRLLLEKKKKKKIDSMQLIDSVAIMIYVERGYFKMLLVMFMISQ